MKLTTRTRYAVRALAYLGWRYGRGTVQLREIADSEGVTEKYLEQIFYRLSRAGLIKTKRGPGGGYELTRKPSAIKLIDILSAVGESFAPVFCVADDKTKVCPRIKNCPARPYWMKLRGALEGFFKNHTLADICGRYKRNG
ncbi:MAG: RrF2 family transcriptional regulator [candidate division WOR-3 bacterium]